MSRVLARIILAATAAFALALGTGMTVVPAASAAPAAHQSVLAPAAPHAQATAAHPAPVIPQGATWGGPAGGTPGPVPAHPVTAAYAAPLSPAAARAPPLPLVGGYTAQIDPEGTEMNFWNGGFPLQTYSGNGGANGQVAIQGIGGGQFELRDNLHGGCIGDTGDSSRDARAQGGLNCPSAGTGAWGTKFRFGSSCGNGYTLYVNVHWDAWVTFANGDNHPVYLNGAGSSATCITQTDPPATALSGRAQRESLRTLAMLRPLGVTGYRWSQGWACSSVYIHAGVYSCQGQYDSVSLHTTISPDGTQVWINGGVHCSGSWTWCGGPAGNGTTALDVGFNFDGYWYRVFIYAAGYCRIAGNAPDMGMNWCLIS